MSQGGNRGRGGRGGRGAGPPGGSYGDNSARGRGRGQSQQTRQPGQPAYQQELVEAEEFILPMRQLAVSEPVSELVPVQPQSIVSQGAEAMRSTLTSVEEVSKFPAKPAKGNLGRKIVLRTNHFQIQMSRELTVYQYDVSMAPKYAAKAGGRSIDDPLSIKGICKEMFIDLQKKLPPNCRNKVVYNFSKNMYSAVKLPFDDQANYEVMVEGREYVVTLKPINQLQIRASLGPNEMDKLQVLDLAFTQNFQYNLLAVGRSFFKAGVDVHRMNFGLELWKGAFASVRPSEIGLTWNIDSANAAFLTSENVLELACSHYNCQPQELKNKMTSDRKENTYGFTFLRDYMNRDIKTKTGGFRKKIKGIGPDSNHKFPWNKGTSVVQISIRDYMKQHYNITLRYPELYCIDLGRESYIPMELCSTELKHKKKLTDKETADIIKKTAVPALEREAVINKWINSSNIANDPVLKEYGIGINLRMHEFDGRVLQAPDIEYQTTAVSSRQIAEKGAWNHTNVPFKNPVGIKCWLIINSSRESRQSLERFSDAMIRVGRSHGMTIDPPLDIINADRNLYVTLPQITTKYKGLDLIVAVFGGANDNYRIIKTFADLEQGIATQVVADKNVYKLNDLTVSNILLKVNNKLKGRNFVLSKNGFEFKNHLRGFYENPIMIFGADVTHPAPGDTKVTESIAAVVGSVDQDCSYYLTRLYAQKSPKGQAYEMIHDLDKMAHSLLQEFFARNNTYPRRIVFFRDGVSEGQFPLVLRHEMNGLRSACAKIRPDYKPAITFVIVQKRHHTRFFPTNPKDQSGRAQNVPPGTVVDKGVVTPDMFDYFLCSHMGIQGTSKPCRYFVLHDENSFNMNQMQLLSHYLCHIYSRCARSVSYPAPAYYAHLAAFRGRDYIRPPPDVRLSNRYGIMSYEIEVHPNLRNKMFYV